MKLKTSTYISAKSPVHECDARIKIVLLFAFTICVFLVETWAGLLIFAALVFGVICLSRVPLRNYFATLVPVYVLMGFSVLFNLLSGESVMCAIGPLAVCADGLVRGCFFALRILMLCLASMIVCYTTTTTALTAAFGWMIQPLRKLHVPVDDVTTVLSIALRFIPLLAAEVGNVRDAHWARGAQFNGRLAAKLGAWGKVFVAVFVGLFRKADRLSASMDARCYGLPGVVRTAPALAHATLASVACLVGGLVVLVAISVLL